MSIWADFLGYLDFLEDVRKHVLLLNKVHHA